MAKHHIASEELMARIVDLRARLADLEESLSVFLDTANIGSPDDQRTSAEEVALQSERRSREFLEKVLESLTHPFYVINAQDFTIKMANSAARLGQLTDTCTCYSMTHRRSEPCGGEHPCPLEEVKRTKQPVVMEHVHFDQDGVLRNVEVHGFPILDDDGNVAEMIEYCLDVTQRKRAEESMRATQEMLQLVMDNIHQRIFWKDRNSVYLGCNKTFAEDAGIGDPASIVGKNDYDMPWKIEESEFFRELRSPRHGRRQADTPHH